MKKFIYLLILLPVITYSQYQQLEYGDFPKPVPSASAVSTYHEAPYSLATGVPAIAVPITSLPSSDGNIVENLSISYNYASAHPDEFVSDTGLGWSLFPGGTISRTVVGFPDEKFSDPNASDYWQNPFDDIYYYNLPTGISGKFKILRIGNSFSVSNMSANNVQIDFTRSSNNATLIITAFTIIDDKGYKYHFGDTSLARYSGSGSIYNSAFYLTDIRNPAGAQLLSYEYQKDTRLKSGTNELHYRSCKLKKINSVGLGSLTITYSFDASLENTKNDPYSVVSIKTENNYGQITGKYNFVYSFHNLGQLKRILTKINKVNLSNESGPLLESTKFDYDLSGFWEGTPLPGQNEICPFNSITTRLPANLFTGILKKITLPTGGVRAYDFEPNEYFLDKNSAQYISELNNGYVDPTIQSIHQVSSNSFNTQSGTLMMWNVIGNPGTKKNFYISFNAVKNPPGSGPITDPGEGTGNLSANIKVNGISLSACYYSATDTSVSSVSTVGLYPGHNNIEIIGYNVSGNITIYEIINTLPPYKNSDYAAGVRIKAVKEYTSSSETTPTKTLSYKYTQFDDSLSSSGFKFNNENISSNAGYVLYRNVRVTEDIAMGHKDYYFKIPSDYVANDASGSIVPYYNITRDGLLDQILIYNATNQRVNSIQYAYELQALSGSTVTSGPNGIRYRPGIISKLTNTERQYVSATDFIENIKELEFSNSLRNYHLIKSKNTSSDGEITERLLTYPFDLIQQGQANDYLHLSDANMMAVPVKVQVKYNGKLMSTTVLKYDAGSFYPTSTLKINAKDDSQKTYIRYDLYNPLGLVRQFTTGMDNSGAGFPTTIIYGYNNTLPIAKIEGATYNQVKWILPPIGADPITNLSDVDVDETTEKTLMTALDEYQNNPMLKDFRITTYTHDPLVGLTSVTPPSGIREIYSYDANGKLKAVLDVNGNILEDYQYNLKPQQ